VPAGRLVSAVIHGGHPGDIESVMVDGEFIMRDNKVLTMDEDAIVREADAVGKRIWKQVGPVTVPRLRRPQ
jgi:5-methylthioadenosine/S-adenosylhomocysteine deaminase